MSDDVQSFQDWCDSASDEIVENLLQMICEGESMELDDLPIKVDIFHTHQLDAVNHVHSGEAAVSGETWAFVVESGNRSGCVVEEWCHPDDAEGYNPPPPTIYTFVPDDDFLEQTRPVMYKVYLAWRELDWFKEKERNYNYDKHFAPGWKTEKYYRDWAESRAMKIAVREES